MAKVTGFDIISKSRKGNVTAWSIVAILAWLVYLVFFTMDLFSRWGQPLVLEFHWQTPYWMVGYVLMKMGANVYRNAVQDEVNAAVAGLKAFASLANLKSRSK